MRSRYMRKGNESVTVAVSSFTREDAFFLSCMRSLGIGVAPYLRCRSFPQDGFPLKLFSTLAETPENRIVAAVPCTTVWTVDDVHDDDVEGLMPPLQSCQEACSSPHVSKHFDLLYLSLYFAIQACRTTSTSSWSHWQRQLSPPATFKSDVEDAAATFLQILSENSIVPPMELMLNMCRYTQTHSCRLTKDRMKLNLKEGPVLAVMPLVDLMISQNVAEGNVALRRCDARQLRSLMRSNPLKCAKQHLSVCDDDAAYWLLETVVAVKEYIPLNL
ncbi:hypothetical protein, conserved [Trypanosoma brucei gambiense DAL972]|uniref:Uncharacterized protein n=3 Tax=Trypanosoma brucei TaxID=5691 RepID=Q4GZE9_TRYB2|nr:hypothetical protein, conserved [Trypanosoma brucei brucei TREU927]XP_011771247.1 hypothetical protein, conserved [Trypanosoma brucei gambiense DAL972]RHW74253.1 hypothetical protein DPX39_010009200 [Trypanosoma brucei equiperdum]CAJ15943.1 hypothetical protein, conserved [Trypanosoma brucei brucei TREU927]CBH08806.1 hypothetical protein, conserved [Trypanosoma brucei gambiense DAL972]|eukprot:XP_011771247.1 hypothetical protein, conserved [Trypanosoma brucei gambiense DAL972]